MRFFYLLLLLIPFKAIATVDNIIGTAGNNILIDNSSRQWTSDVFYTTDGLGNIKTLNGLTLTSDSLTGTAGNNYLLDNHGRLWNTSVCYTTDGIGNVIPVTGGGGGGGTPGGASTDIQFNAGGAFDGNSNFTYDGTNVTVLGTLGVGVTAGAYPLDIVGNGTGTGNGNVSFNVEGAGTETGFQLNNTTPDGTAWVFTSAGTGSEYNPGSFSFVNGNSSINVMNISPEGQFVINTPGYETATFGIGNNAIDEIQLLISANEFQNNPIVRIDNYGGTQLLAIDNSGNISGGKVQLNGTATMSSGSLNPSETATSGVRGDMYLSNSTGNLFLKQDSGSNTHWMPLSPPNNIVWQVGGSGGQNIYTNWTDVYAAISVVRGPVTIIIDDRLGQAIIPSGTWDLTNVVFQGLPSDGYLSNNNIRLNNGCVFTGAFPTLGGNVSLVTYSSSSVFTPTSGSQRVNLYNGSSLLNSNAAPLIDIEGTATLTLYLDNSSNVSGWGNPTTTIVNLGAGRGMNVYMNENSTVTPYAFSSTDSTAYINLTINAAISSYSNNQGGYYGTINTFTQANLSLYGSSTQNQVSLSAAASTTAYPLVLPPSQGAGGTVPVNDGSGNLTWGISSNSYTFQPGGTAIPANNVYTDWPTLYSVISNIPGLVTVLLDNTYGSPTIPAGTYSLSNITLVGINNVGQVFTNLSDGCVFTSFPILDNVLLNTQSTTPVYSINNSQGYITLKNGSQLFNNDSGASAMVDVSNNGSLILTLGDNTAIEGDVSFPVINLHDTSYMEVTFYNNAGFYTESLIGDGGTSVVMSFYSNSAIYDTTQDGFLGNYSASQYTILHGSISGSVNLAAPYSTSSYALFFPAAQGGAGNTWINNGSGNMSWATLLSQSKTTTSQNGSISGSAVFDEPFTDPTYKKVVVHLASLHGTASYTFPTAFTYTPQIVTTNGPAAAIVTSLSSTAMTVTGATTTGFIILEGY